MIFLSLSKQKRQAIARLLTAVTTEGPHKLPVDYWTGNGGHMDDYPTVCELRDKLNGNAGLAASDPYERDED